jgi:predicted nuclease of predicted toxin-antitoxin system
MKLKLDENLGRNVAEPFRRAGHDVSTVHEQWLQGTPDASLIAICAREGRCLVTLDLDFANPLVFRPADYRGIAVLRLPPKSTPDDLLDAVLTLIGGLERDDIDGKLWIMQRGRIRQYQPDDILD